MNTFRLAIVAPVEEWKTRRDIVENLNLALAWLGDGWHLTEPENANIVLLIMKGDERSRVLWEEQCRLFTPERILVCGTGNLPDGVKWSLAEAHRAMPTALTLVNSLMQMQESLMGYSAPEDFFHPENHIQGIIEKAVVDGISRVLSLPESSDARLYLLPKEKSCYIFGNLEKSIPLCLAERQSIQITEITDEELLRETGHTPFSSNLSKYIPDTNLIQEIGSGGADRYTLDELMWFATLVNARGRLRAGCSHEDCVLIKHWPEFTRLPHYQAYFDISKGMTLQAMRLTDMAAHMNLPVRQVVDVHNACELLGLVTRNDHAQREAQRHIAARKQLYNLLKPFANAGGQRLKLVIAGTVGSGKTTVITKLSDFAPLTTETRPSDHVSQRKSSTTVAMDYGETRFEDMKLFIYGSPGQKRFEFMGQLLCRTAWALLILIDNTEADPLAELDYYLNLYRSELGKLRVMIGITHCDEGTGLSVDQYRNYLARQGVYYPVAQVDPRDYLDLVRFFKDTLTEDSDSEIMLRAMGGGMG